MFQNIQLQFWLKFNIFCKKIAHFLWASSQEDEPGAPPDGGEQEATRRDSQATLAGSFRHEEAAALL